MSPVLASGWLGRTPRPRGRKTRPLRGEEPRKGDGSWWREEDPRTQGLRAVSAGSHNCSAEIAPPAGTKWRGPSARSPPARAAWSGGPRSLTLGKTGRLVAQFQEVRLP